MIETKDGTYAFDLIDCCTYDLCEEDNYCEGKVLFAVHKPAPEHPPGVWVLARTFTADELAAELVHGTNQ